MAVGGVSVIALRCRRNVNTYPAVAVGGVSMATLGVQVEFNVMGLYLDLSCVHNNNEGIIRWNDCILQGGMEQMDQE